MKRLFALALALAIVSLLSWMCGTEFIAPAKIFAAWPADSDLHYSVWQYRLPRVFLAVFAGAALAASGTLIQSTVNNPLASPDILGISHGAGLAAVLLMVFWPKVPVWALPPAAFAGALAAFLLLMLFARGSGKLRPALIGVALAVFYAAVSDYLLLASPLEINTAMVWLTGSLWGRGWPFVLIALPVLALLLPAAMLFCRDLDAFTLGGQKAATLGVAVNRRQAQILLLAVALAAVAVAVCGPIGFLGLAAPHAARQLIGGQHRLLLPAAMLTGALLLQAADLLARTVKPPLELPAGLITAVIGAPYFFYLLRKIP